jgi:hypothetical protein
MKFMKKKFGMTLLKKIIRIKYWKRKGKGVKMVIIKLI